MGRRTVNTSPKPDLPVDEPDREPIGEPRLTNEQIAEHHAREMAAQEADRLIVLADERKAAAVTETEEATPEAPPNGETGEAPLKRRAVISIMGTDKVSGERTMLHRARSKRAARKWAYQCTFMLLRLYDDLTVAVTREESLL